VSETLKQNQDLGGLLNQASRGDEVAFGQIYDLYFEKIYRFVFYRVNHKEAAEDLTSEIFIRVWGKLSGIKDIATFNGWIFQIARNLVIDYYRSRKEHVDLTVLENVLLYEENFLERADFQIQHKELLESIKKLSPDQQVVIKLKFLDGLDNGEIAKILNKSEGAIRVIQHRATMELKNLLPQNQ